MIRQAHQVSIAGRTVFRALALAGAVTLVVTAGCGGGSSTSTTPDAATTKYDVLPQSTTDTWSPPADAASGKDTWVPPADTMVVTSQDLAPISLDTGRDTPSADLSVPPPDAADASVADVGGADTSILVAEVGGVDSSIPMDGAGGNCPSAVQAWGYQLPGTSGLNSVAWDNDGTLLTGATFYPTTTTFGGTSVTNKGSSDLLVAKLDPSTGNAKWVLSAGDQADQSFSGVVPVGTTAAVHGSFKGTIALPVKGVTKRISNPNTTPIDYLIGLNDSDGSALWSESIDLGGGTLVTLAANPGKDYFLVCGYANNDASDLGVVGTPGGGADVVVAAVKASDGTVVWAKLFGGAMDQKCLAAALDDSGNAYFAGVYAGSLDFGGGALPAGATVTSRSNTGITWVAKFNGADGTFLAAKSFGTTANVVPSALSLDPQGALLLAGNFNSDVTFGTQLLATSGGLPNGSLINGNDGFVAKLNSSSIAPVWARSLTAPPGYVAGCVGIASNSTGNVTVTGHFSQTVTVGPGNTVLQAATTVGGDLLVVTLSGASGDTLCAQNYGDPASTGIGANGISINSRAMDTNKDRAAIVGFFADVINFGGSTTALSSGSAISGTKQGFLLEM